MRARALFAQMEDERIPILVAAMDQTIWDHLDEDPWITTRNEWPSEYEWREAWIEIGDDAWLALFPPTPEIVATLAAAEDTQP
jgi:hypothetical protein